jgi:hypothetical protein
MLKIIETLRTKYMGLPVAILCNRYWYRGIVKKADKDMVTLTDARAVEVTGPATGMKPITEDRIPSDVHIPSGTIEVVCQPNWVWHEVKINNKNKKAKSETDLRVKNLDLERQIKIMRKTIDDQQNLLQDLTEKNADLQRQQEVPF